MLLIATVKRRNLETMRMSPRLMLTSALVAPFAGLILAGCVTAPPAAPGPVAVAPGEESTNVSRSVLGGSNYGLFLAGEAALQNGRSQDAALYFSKAAEGAADLRLIGRWGSVGPADGQVPADGAAFNGHRRAVHIHDAAAQALSE